MRMYACMISTSNLKFWNSSAFMHPWDGTIDVTRLYSTPTIYFSDSLPIEHLFHRPGPADSLVVLSTLYRDFFLRLTNVFMHKE
jgi:hypothetical protein